MILGSHNSMTYLPVKQWYFKPLFWTARCQSKSIESQYKLGVRVFDFRIKFINGCEAVFAHGPIQFKGNPFEALEKLNNLAKDDTIYVRVVLESNSEMKNQREQEQYFTEFCDVIVDHYTNLVFFGGNRKYDWKVVYKFDAEDVQLDDKYSSTTDFFGGPNTTLRAKLDDLWPWLYAKTHNKRTLKAGTDKDCLFIDFVNIR